MATGLGNAGNATSAMGFIIVIICIAILGLLLCDEALELMARFQPTVCPVPS